MGNYGIKVSRPTFDVEDATDRELAMTSKYKTFNTVVTGSATITVTTSDFHKTTTVAHGLGYVPSFVVFGQEDGESTFKNIPYTPAFLDISNYFMQAWADDTNLYLNVEFGGATFPSAETYNFKYYIFNNKIE